MFEKIGLKEIAAIVSVMGESYGTGPIIGEVEVDGKIYSYDKEDDITVVTCSDGRKMSIKINSTTERERDSFNREIVYCNHDVNVDYYKEDGSRINLYNKLSLNEGYEGFEGVQRHDLLAGLAVNRINACGKKEASLNIDLSKVTMGDDYNKYVFTEKGIEHGNNLISLDGEELKMIFGSKIPDKALIDSFDAEKEKAKVEKLAFEMGLHDFTSSIIKKTLDQIDTRNSYIQSIRKFYKEEIKDVRKAIKLREETSKDMDKYTIEAEPLEKIATNIRDEYIRNIKLKRL